MPQKKTNSVGANGKLHKKVVAALPVSHSIHPVQSIKQQVTIGYVAQQSYRGDGHPDRLTVDS